MPSVGQTVCLTKTHISETSKEHLSLNALSKRACHGLPMPGKPHPTPSALAFEQAGVCGAEKITAQAIKSYTQILNSHQASSHRKARKQFLFQNLPSLTGDHPSVSVAIFLVNII